MLFRPYRLWPVLLFQIEGIEGIHKNVLPNKKHQVKFKDENLLPEVGQQFEADLLPGGTAT